MKGYLYDQTGAHLAELPKEDFHVRLHDGQLQFGPQAIGDGLFTLEWDVRRTCWKLGPCHPELFVDGAPAKFAPQHLGRRAVFQIGAAYLRFEQELDAPKLGGKSGPDLAIAPALSPLVIGRGEGAEKTPNASPLIPKRASFPAAMPS